MASSCAQCRCALAPVAGPALSAAKAPAQAQTLALASPAQGSLCARHARVPAPYVSARKMAVAAQETDVVAPAASAHVDGAAGSKEAEIQDPSAFISDVTSLIKLVDSRDIVELEMKHANYEVLIRKKEAVDAASSLSERQTFPGPHVMAHTAWPAFAPGPPAPLPQAPAAAPPPAPAAAPAPPPPPKAPSAGSGLPAMLSPMAGTLYRSPAPGEPPFVKVGDRVQKGQVVCIIEAMKLMNEIEADQSGTIAEILADDGKPVSIETPLFVIKP